MSTYESYRKSIEISGKDEFGVPRYRLNDGNEIPGIAFGTFDLDVHDGSARSAVANAIEAGYRHIDAARFYGNEAGVGEGIADGLGSVPRSELFVSSKVWNDAQRKGEVRESFMRSLEELGLDYLDQFLLHWPEPGVFRKGWEVLQALQGEGLVRSIGVSNFNRACLDEILSDGDAVPVVNQMEHHLLNQQMDTLAACAEHKIIYEAWSPLGRGAAMKTPELVELASREGVSAAELVLAWHTANLIIPLPRTKTPSHLVSNLSVFNIKLAPETVVVLAALNRNEPIIAQVCPEDFSMLAPTTSEY